MSENVTFYQDNNGLPGELVVECDDLKGADNQGSFAITVPKTCKILLRGGRTYWVAVVANMDFDPYGLWGWETRARQRDNPAAWENPRDGFRTGCKTWGVMTSCIGEGGGEGPDFMFALKGKDIVF